MQQDIFRYNLKSNLTKAVQKHLFRTQGKLGTHKRSQRMHEHKNPGSNNDTGEKICTLRVNQENKELITEEGLDTAD